LGCTLGIASKEKTFVLLICMGSMFLLKDQ
jgi:hypothetical protein